MKNRGIFITFEGCEGCGKTTHSKAIKKYLVDKGFDVVLTHEPGSTTLGKQIRKILLSEKSVLSPNAELLLFAADRAQHVDSVIMPGLAEGKIVICDRYIDSTVAYQIGGRGLPEDMVRYLNAISSKGLIPDLTIFLDVNPEVGIKRVVKSSGKRDRFEMEKIAFHEKVRGAYLNIYKEDPGRVVVINSEKEIKTVQTEIRSAVDKLLDSRRSL